MITLGLENAKLDGMLLQVEWAGFVEAVDQWVGRRHAAVSPYQGKTLVTSGSPHEAVIISVVVEESSESVTEDLKSQMFQVVHGKWSTDDNPASNLDDAVQSHVVAIAYKSREEMPGLWVDSFPFAPNQGEALKALYDHFEETGEIENVSFKQFVHAARPNVVVLSPEDMERFAKMKAIE